MADSDDKVIPDDVESMLLDAAAPVDAGPEVADRIKRRLFDRIRGEVEISAEKLVTVTAKTGEWIETSPGNEIKILRIDDESMSMMVRLGPGSTFPRHFHPEDEETYVIEGETWFGDTHLVAGDYHFAPKGTSHGEVRTDTGCLLFIRKVSE